MHVLLAPPSEPWSEWWK